MQVHGERGGAQPSIETWHASQAHAQPAQSVSQQPAAISTQLRVDTEASLCNEVCEAAGALLGARISASTSLVDAGLDSMGKLVLREKLGLAPRLSMWGFCALASATLVASLVGYQLAIVPALRQIERRQASPVKPAGSAGSAGSRCGGLVAESGGKTLGGFRKSSKGFE